MADQATPQLVTFTTPLFRISYANLDKPSKMEGSDGEPKYGITCLFKTADFTPADQARWKALRQGVVAALREKFGAKAFDSNGKVIPAYKLPFHDGMEKPNVDGYGAGVVFFRAANKNPPGMGKIVAGQKQKVSHDVLYSGAYARASISFWGYDNKSKGIAVNLHNVIFIGDGERFGNVGPAIENDFSDLSEDEIGFDDPMAGGATADDELAF